MKQELELYLHIPFCARKCAYCDFFSGAFSDAQMKRYFQDLREDIRRKSAQYDDLSGLPIRSIFIGGGTPSIADPEELDRTVRVLRECFPNWVNPEFSMEANPGTLDREKLQAYREFGLNRLSLGLQSADDRMLEKLGRIHDFGTFLRSFDLARAAGFNNINIDLMSGLPGETPQNFEKSLRTALSLQPEHLSVYSLQIEENTPFYALYGPEGKKIGELPTEETDRRIYRRTSEVLHEYQMERYEISNYAKPGFECRHNIGYWTGGYYLGFGAAAASYTEKSRIKNAASLDYLNLPPEEEECLDCSDRMSEFMILGLRMTCGVSDADFRDRFCCSFFDHFQEPIERHLKIGTLEKSGDRIFLSDYGLDVANSVMADFL